MGNCACTKDQNTEQVPFNKGKPKGKGGNPVILSEALDGDDQIDDNGEEGGACENLLRPNKKISLNDFELVKVIGRGSFGKVYLVKRNGTQNHYAMKKLKKDVVAKRNLFIKTQAERDILEKIDSPFIVKLHYAFQTPAKLYFVMDFLNGGELFYHLRKDQKFSERRACFYAAQLVEALRCLHQNGIIYRDLKPENVLLDHEGYIKITDFGLSKQGLETNKAGARTYSYCGTPEYLAPEIIQGIGHGKAADWWSLGALLYEMLCGRPPHYQKNRKQMMYDIVNVPVQMQRHFSSEAKSLLTGLLNRDQNKRLGSSSIDASDIMSHPFFRDIQWKDLRERRVPAPYKPTVASEHDTRNIDKMFTNERPVETPEQTIPNTIAKKTDFQAFTYDRDGLQGIKSGQAAQQR